MARIAAFWPSLARASALPALLLAAFLALLLAVGPAAAQDADDDGEGFLTRLIERQLSGGSYEVDINGFQGALSSRATVARIAVSDREGEWLVIENAVLDWNRSALLRGRLEVEELAADRISLPRLPVSDRVPSSTATSFSIPELPVSVQIGRVAVGRVEIGAPVFGEAAVVSLEGSGSLADGGLDVDIVARRVDGKEGRFEVALSYAPETSALGVRVALSEAPEGLVANALGIPGRPALDLDIQGTGPLDDFAATIDLDTGGADRLSGDVTIAALPGGPQGARRFNASISGDVAPLLAPEYQGFFGNDLSLQVAGTRGEDGQVAVETLALRTAALRVSGTAALGAGGAPESFDLDISLGGEAEPVRLPIGGEVRVGSAELEARFDAATGERWTLSGQVSGIEAPGVRVARLALDGGGVIAQGEAGRFTAEVTAEASGIAPEDPGLAAAIGDAVTARAEVALPSGGPISIDALRLDGDGYGVTAQGTLADLTFDGQIGAQFADLDRLSTLAGVDLGGALDVSAQGSVALIGGGFDVAVTGTGRDLSIGIDAVDALIGGKADLALDVARTPEGTQIREAIIGTEALGATVTGRIAPDDAQLRYTARLDDLGRVVPQLSGRVQIEGSADRNAERWRVTAQASAPEGTEATLFAVLPDEGEAAVDFQAQVGDLGALAPALAGPAQLTGRAERDAAGDWAARFGADLPQGIAAEATARVPEGGPISADLDARVEDLGAFVEALSGPATLSGTATISGGDIEARVVADGPEGLAATVTLRRPEGGMLSADYEASIDDVGALTGLVSGPARVSGTLSQTEDGYRTELEASAPAGTTATAIVRLGAEGLIEIDASATIERPEELRDGLPGPIEIALDARRAGGAWDADLQATAPEGTEVTVSANLPPEGQARVTFEARLAQPERYLNGLPGPVTARGTATRQEGRWEAEIRADAPDGSFLEASGTLADAGPIDARFDARLADLGRFVPELPGEATASGTLSRQDGAWSGEARLAAPRGLSAEVSAQIPPEGEAQARFSASIDQIGAFVPQLDGPARAEGTATREGGVWSARADLSAPAGIRAKVDATLGEGGDFTADYDASIDDLGVFVPQLAGAAQARGTVRREGGALTAEASVTAPQGIVASLDAKIPAEGPAEATFDARIRDLGVFVQQLSGPARVQGSARREDSVWRAEASATAPAGITASADAVLRPDGGAEISYQAAIDDLGAFVPQLPGAARLEGTATREDGAWRAQATLSAPAGIEADLSADVAEGGAITAQFDVRVGALGQIVPQLAGAARVTGTARYAEGDLGVQADIQAPQGLSANVDVSLPAGGALAVDFDARLANLGAFAEGLSGALTASGRFAREGDRWALSVDVQGPAGADARIDGSLAGDFSSADLTARGALPLALANPRLEPRSIEGTARFDLALNGPLALSSLSGRVTLADGRLSLPRFQQSIEDIDAEVTLTGGRARIDLTAAPSAGGRLSVSGPIELSPPFTAGLDVVLDGIGIRDPLLYETTIDGRLRIAGPLTGGGGAITGTIDVGPTEIRIPTSGFGGSGAIPVIKLEGAPLDVRLTRERARLAETDPANRDGTERRGGGFALDILVRAENRIFVRGRGLDAELGGSLRLTGRTSNIIPVGQFELIRGRLDLLGKRIDLDEGAITLQGNFTPFIRLVARIEDDAGDLSVVVEGPLTEPEVTFESAAGLPQDEAVARILFGRDVRNLSPLQAARLANAVATLSGRGGVGIVDSIRESTGLDDLDLTAQEDGSVGLRAGRYLTENIYTDVTIGSDGDTELNINLDLTPNLTVRGSAGADGETGIGLFYELDY